MIKSLKIIYSFWVVIALVADISTAFAVIVSVPSNSSNVECVDSSKNISHQNTHKDSDLKIEKKNSISPLDRWIMAVSRIKSGSGLCSVNEFSNTKAAELTATASSQPIVVESNLNPSNSNTLSIFKKRNEFCDNKSYAYSAMHVFTKGFSQSFSKELDGITYMMSRDFIASTDDIIYFTGCFNDFITGKSTFDYIYKDDKFFRSFDWSVNQIRQQDSKYDSIPKDFLCSNNLIQDPDKFIIGVLTILGMDKSPLITSQVETKPCYARDYELKNNDSDNIGIEIEELTTVQRVSLEFEDRGYLVDDFFESLCSWRGGKLEHKDVCLHVDTEKFSHLIVKFEIFTGISYEKNKKAINKVVCRKINIINSSKSIIINVNDINDIGCVDKKDSVKYKLTPIAAISHKGHTLERGHFVAKISTKKPNGDVLWTLYDKDSEEVSSQKRSEVAPGYDDYIIVYEAGRVFD